jgi:hypothetical protein
MRIADGSRRPMWCKNRRTVAAPSYCMAPVGSRSEREYEQVAFDSPKDALSYASGKTNPSERRHPAEMQEKVGHAVRASEDRSVRGFVGFTLAMRRRA